MDTSWVDGLTDSDIIAVVGAGAFRRGLDYATDGKVVELSRGGGGTLFGTVTGSAGRVYSTLVTGTENPPSGVGRFSGRCTCPMEVDCKHVAAVVLETRGAAAASQEGQVAAWEGVLGGIVGAHDAERSTTHGTPLGLMFEVVPPRTRSRYAGATTVTAHTRVRLQPVTPGKTKRWIRTGVSWRDLGFGYARPGTDRRHVDALGEFFFAHQARTRHAYYATADQAIHLDELGVGVWRLLHQLEQAGVALVAGTDTAGRVVLSEQEGTASLDLRRSPDGSTAVEPVLSVGGVVLPASAVHLVGDPAHGCFLGGSAAPRSLPRLAAGDLLLVPFTEQVSPQLSKLLYDGRRLDIPAADLGRFLQEYYPSLRQAVPVSSSDGSLELPEIEPPRLALTVTYGTAHTVRLDWGFAYRVGEDVTLVPLRQERDSGSGPGSGSRRRAAETAPTVARDAATEEALLAKIDLPTGGLRKLALPSGDRHVPVPTVELSGLETAIFTQEVLPLLRELDDLLLEVVGEVPDYRFTDATPVIHLSTSDLDDDGEDGDHGFDADDLGDGEAEETSDWFGLGVTVTIDGEQIPFRELFVALARGDTHLLLDSGTWFRIDRPELERLRQLIDEARTLQDHDSPELRISKYQAGLWEELVALGVVEEQSRRWGRAVQGLLDLEEVQPPEVPDGLAAELRPYQRDGYQWLSFLWDHGLGGVLADDMGLGKTVQTLAMVCRAVESGRADAPFLVVAPTSVVGNWAHEAARFAPELTVVTIEASERKRGTQLADEVAGADLVVTSYALFRIDEQAYAGSPWAGLVLDEAQFVKNHQAKTYQCARRLPAPFKLAITGTPLENNLLELWSLLSIVAPGLFPHPQRFTEVFAKPIEKAGDTVQLAALRQRIRPLIRRRTKEQVAADLPAKQEQVLEVELNPKHRRIYQTHLQRERQKVLGLINDMDKHRFAIFRSLTLLRQLALAPGLVDEDYAHVRSSKADAFFEHLDEVVGEGHRALVFSQFTGFLRLVRDRLDAEGVPYCYLDGRTRDRARRIEEFKSGDAPVFLISLKAGGFGLNLTEADYCFLLDPWWNPAVESQAVDRTHRIGQDKQVLVYRLVSTGTIEEKVMELKERKRGLFNQVMDDDALLSAPLTAEDIRGLFG
ncbi:MAG TPA: DEAD/DEAH box helicase [Segeticoccus sp.]|uniref:DEAD/DEAH box helicase n=1 Tax=Segeticoccus sp. TaxID=2706531 RepID=UPI002D8116B4|nr:DEAD/DEAH box helicase [Segeticoccus sp.]HET8600015.1 DEAD/DEAH box helicase [Segeticoccus sp.]